MGRYFFMLQKLTVKNFALIESLEVEFSSGFNIITGETGAGKSILLGALSLITGKRADTTSISTGARKCIVEAEFKIEASVGDWFRENDIDFEENTIIRREIKDDGKSRAFINDVPVNLNQLKEFSAYIIDIHSQHDVYALSDANFRLEVLDCFNKNSELLKKYKQKFSEFIAIEKEFQHLKESHLAAKHDADYMQFRWQELESAGLREGMKAEMEQELNVLNHAELIAGNLSHALALLSSEDVNILSQLNQAKNLIQKLSGISGDYQNLFERLAAVVIELKDINSELEHAAEKVIINPDRIQKLNDSLSLIYKLEKIHGVEGDEALIEIRNNLALRLSGIESNDEKLELLKLKLKETETLLTSLADELHKSRVKAAEVFEKEVRNRLAELHMPDSKFEVKIEKTARFMPDGTDEVKFYFTANKGVPAADLQKIASGGEMSRVMLSIKSAITEKKALPTIIFDEIDTGISGKVADKAGELMKQISEGTQVIAITHLPQIASKGTRHFKVEKETLGNKTKSIVRTLDFEERVEELAEMLSGKKLSPEAMANARILLG